MSDLTLQILQPVNGAGFPSGTTIPLEGSVTGDSAGIFFKWFSSLNSATTKDHPELNTDHSAGILHWTAPLPEFGSHAILLAGTDKLKTDIPSLKAVTRSAMAGGAPPAAPQPCVIHRLVAQISTPATDGIVLSKAAATLEFLAPGWAMPDPNHPDGWLLDKDYQKVNGIDMGFHLAPTGASDPSHSADIPLTLAGLPYVPPDPPKHPTDPPNLPTLFRWTGALPSNLGTGNYILTLTVSGGGVSTSASRNVILTA